MLKNYDRYISERMVKWRYMCLCVCVCIVVYITNQAEDPSSSTYDWLMNDSEEA